MLYKGFMQDIIDTLNEALDGEKYKVVCVKEYKTKFHTFAKGEECEATKINSNWWIIDSIGIAEKPFKNCFKKNPR